MQSKFKIHYTLQVAERVASQKSTKSVRFPNLGFSVSPARSPPWDKYPRNSNLVGDGQTAPKAILIS